MPAAVSVEIWCFYRPKEKVETELPNVSVFAEGNDFLEIREATSLVVVRRENSCASQGTSRKSAFALFVKFLKTAIFGP
jgi:hypothetical protein